jgi:hypothetical protein
MWNVPNASRALYASMLAFDKTQLAPKPTVALELLSKIRPETNVHRITSWSASFLILACALSLNAQTSSGTIEGHIVDASKALVGGAHVTLTEQQTAQIRTENADPSGYFEFRAVPIGLYAIQVEAPGFAKEIETGIHLDVAETKAIDVSLRAAAQSETVTVQSNETMLQVADPSLSSVIDQRRVVDLPINGRNVLQLTSLAPGVVTSAKGSATERQANYGPGFAVGGQRDNTNIVLVDGIEISGMESRFLRSTTSRSFAFKPPTTPRNSVGTREPSSISPPGVARTIFTARSSSFSGTRISMPATISAPRFPY